MGNGMIFSSTGKVGVLLVAGFVLAGCEDGFQGLNFGKGKSAEAETSAPNAGAGNKIKLVERDVEAPEVFEKNENALWDGRPSLGGVWVAHADSKQPERVIIRNEANNKFVIGALFRRERANPGPALQLSSDAAAELGVQAGTPTKLRVTALRRETVNETPVAEDVTPNVTETVAATDLDAPASDDAALQAQILASVAAAENKAKPAEKPVAKPTAAKGAKYVQIGFFSVENNAKSNAKAMQANGIPATVVKSESKGKTFWRVIAGPATTPTEQRQLLGMVKGQGFADAYLVKG
ncbi:SPOR domain-containing protein [Amylibacter sp. IMCC11727]|uniref:SPOR domain-containing protein n=1 Tax=Amylibacter sp. IMCC11727 TaxID=3039851 RepID=UPI00244E4619|nr:SPOR domain-containing protein [Amylibacter sp. IMCC11727]WGI20521.1 SPOR domain-containing protein [Amylibacter sp. IMCC11727]